MNMTKTATKLTAILALVLLALTQAQTASAAIRYRVRNGMTATVRNNRNGFVLGTLFSGESVDVRCTVGSYAFGYAHGDADRRGWVLLERIERPGRAKPPRCSRPYPVIPLRSFMRPLNGDPHGRTVEKNSITCRDGRQSRCDGSRTHLLGCVTTNPAQINGAQQVAVKATLYFNVRNGTPVGRRAVEIGCDTPIYWRYVTRDNGHVLVRAVINEQSRWGFIARGHLPPSSELPVDTKCEQPRRKREGCDPKDRATNN